jgi:hypothetical protein
VVTLGSVAELVEDDARFDTSQLRLGINRCQASHVLRKVEDHGHVGALASQACAGAAREHGGSGGAAGGQRGFDVGGVAGKDYTHGELAVAGGVGGVERARAEVEADLSAKRGLETSFEFVMGSEVFMLQRRLV